MTKIKRVCLFGGPGSGKTNLAHWLSSELNFHDLTTQYIDEFVKLWACQGRVPEKWDQATFFESQRSREYAFIKSGSVDVVVSDSPLLLVGAYCRILGSPIGDELLSLAVKFEKDFPAVNILLDRTGIPYRTEGRYQSEKEAHVTDKTIKDTLDEFIPGNYEIARTKDRHEVLEKILKAVK